MPEYSSTYTQLTKHQTEYHTTAPKNSIKQIQFLLVKDNSNLWFQEQEMNYPNAA